MAQDGIATRTSHGSLSMGKYGRDVQAALALDVHEEGIGALHQAFLFVQAGFGGSRRIKQVNNQLQKSNEKSRKLIWGLLFRRKQMDG